MDLVRIRKLIDTKKITCITAVAFVKTSHASQIKLSKQLHILLWKLLAEKRYDFKPISNASPITKPNNTYRVFIKYCVFFRIFKNIPGSVFPRCQCVYTNQAGRKPALQQNWQSSEKSQHLKEKTQYLMNTLYMSCHAMFHVKDELRTGSLKGTDYNNVNCGKIKCNCSSNNKGKRKKRQV